MIRRATQADIGEMQEVFVSSLKGELPEKQDIEDWKAMIQNGGVYVYEEANQIIGFGALEIRRGYIDALYVRTDYKRQGIGPIILNQLEELAKLNGIEVVELDAAFCSETFYDKWGYERVSESIGKDKKIFHMRKKL